MEENRYERHFLLEGFGRDGQKKLADAKVLIVGVGGLGSPVAMYLASAGIGKLGLIDADVVDVTNLQRQIIHSESSVGVDKVISAKQRISELNSETEVVTYNFFFDKNNADSIAKSHWAEIQDTITITSMPTIPERTLSTTSPPIWRKGWHT